jgi:hypothetical protein
LGTTYEECANSLLWNITKKQAEAMKFRAKYIEAINEIERQIALFEQSADKNVIKPGFEK